ncbi:MAG: type II toxin-antitoxin system HicB family antitoxin [Chloroflexi bacterium]|nr:type II toxin-antitoxin system HicB family antitoxin [Chloroflexota bacterium]
MKLYRLHCVIREPVEGAEEKYVAEVPALPGCRAWGDTAAEALENLQGVAAAFIESYRDRGDALPQAIESASLGAGSRTFSEVLVAV